MKLPEGILVNGQVRNWFLYYLVRGIYPEWAIFLKPNRSPLTLQEKAMSVVHERQQKV